MAQNLNNPAPLVAFVTMGCAKNEVDTQQMSSLLKRAGYSVTDDLDGADVIVVNTCSFIQAATEESIEAVLDVVDLPRVKEDRCHVVVAGCMPSRYRDQLSAEIPEVSVFVPCDEEALIVERIDHVLGIERQAIGQHLIQGATEIVDSNEYDHVSAYVKISDGCNRFCSYCTIPFIRGRYHSFSQEEIENQVLKLVNRGVREIALIGQDTGRWGDDLEEGKTLAGLMDNLAEAFPKVWFRVMYLQPEGVTDDLLEVVARHENICSYFDIPFQHCNETILKSMNRRGSRPEYSELIEKIRRAVPGVTLRTTLIVGFPGETEEQFDELCEFVSELCLDYVGVFAYSREEGTRAYDLPGQIDEDEKLYRAQRLRDLADDVSSGVIQARIGNEADILICGSEEDGQLFGRAQSQAPDVDGVTFINKGNPGDIVHVRIVDTLMYEMEAEVD